MVVLSKKLFFLYLWSFQPLKHAQSMFKWPQFALGQFSLVLGIKLPIQTIKLTSPFLLDHAITQCKLVLKLITCSFLLLLKNNTQYSMFLFCSQLQLLQSIQRLPPWWCNCQKSLAFHVMYVKLSIQWLKGNASTEFVVQDKMPQRIHWYPKINSYRLAQIFLPPGSIPVSIRVIEFLDHISEI